MRNNYLRKNKKIITVFLLCLTVAVFSGCGKSGGVQTGTPRYITAIKNWHKQRIKNLKKTNGWLNLAGLFWLKEGNNKIGTAEDNDIVFPKGKAPAHIGTVILKNGEVTFRANPAADVTSNGKPVADIKMKSDMTGDPTVLAVRSLRWFIIKRADKTGIRLRDLNAALVKNFNDIKTFPINQHWKITAEFVPYRPPKIITIASIIGTSEKDTVEGKLVFKFKGKPYSLDPVEEGNKFFIIFADQTSGIQTYGAGRFLYADQPDSSGKVVLDFNKAYNPPCAFTPYATCPLPPKENYLHISITAGEKKYGGRHHT